MMKFLSLSLLAGAMMSGARAEMQMAKGGDMCAGYDDGADDFKIYYGPCVSAATVGTTETTPYFTAETKDMALISGGDTAYLSDTSKITEIDATGTYSNAEKDKPGPGGSTYAYVIGTAKAVDGTRIEARFGTAFYMVQTGTVSTSINSFPLNDDGTGNVDVCISQITDGACGSARSWSAGHLKYTLYGSIVGTDVAGALGTAEYFGVRQHVTIQRSEAVTVTFNGGIALDAIGGADITSFKIAFAGGKVVTHTFPTKYNVGSTSDCAAPSTAAPDELVCTTVAGRSFSRDVKIKVSDDGIPGSMGVNFDYLFTLAPSATGVNDGLNSAGRYFVYDPDVAAATTTGTTTTGTTTTGTTTTGTTTTGTTTTDTTSPKASGATTTFNGVVLAALAAAMFFQG